MEKATIKKKGLKTADKVWINLQNTHAINCNKKNIHIYVDFVKTLW